MADMPTPEGGLKAIEDRTRTLQVATRKEYSHIGDGLIEWLIPMVVPAHHRENTRISLGWAAPNPEKVPNDQRRAMPWNPILVICGSGGRSTLGMSALPAAGGINLNRALDGMEGDLGADPGNAFRGTEPAPS